jgi:hypothetical protein
MLSSILRSRRAVMVNVQIMRVFVRLRRLSDSNAALAAKIDELERRYDGQFEVVFEAIRAIMAPPAASKRRIGFNSRSPFTSAPRSDNLPTLTAKTRRAAR